MSLSRAAELRRRLEERLASLTPEQRARLDLPFDAEAQPREDAIRPRPAGIVVPLTHAQELLWVLDRSAPGLAAYNLPRVYRFEGALDLGALQRAVDLIVARHEILRTAFVILEGRPVQEVRPAAPVPVEIVDLRQVPAGEREAEAASAVKRAIRKPISLEGGVLLRATIIRVADAEQIVVLLTHHIASDGWSRRVLEQELATFYNGFVAGGLPELPPPRLQFGDYAVWERERLSGARLECLLGYWREQLAGAPALVEFPTDRPRSSLPRFEGARLTRALSPALSPDLAATATRLGASRFQVLLAAYHALLSRYAERDDVLVSVPMAERHRSELEGVIGYLINTLPIRTRPSPDLPFSELVAQVRQAFLGADEHRDIPFETLAVDIGTREGGRPLQPQVSFALAGGEGAPPLAMAGLTRKPMPYDPGWAKFELALTLIEHPAGLQAGLDYRTDLFDEETAERFVGHYETLLAGALKSPDTAIGALPLLTEHELRCLDEWNATRLPYPTAETIHGLVQAQSRRTPGALAVVAGDARLSYAELETRAEAIAARLRAAGVQPRDRVGICAPRTVDLIAGLLGVLKAGGAYVPLDPAYPQERLAFILDDAEARVVLTHPDTVAVLPPHTGTNVDLTAAGDPPPATGHAAHQVSAEDVGYLIYTSGSTGRPKGVEIRHRNAVAFVTWAQTVFAKEQFAGVLAGTSICFDLSIFEIFATLSSGGSVLLVKDGLDLAGAPADLPVTMLNTVPSVIAELLRLGPLPETVATVNLAGEPLSQALVELIYAEPGVRRVYDLYGPSETTTYSTYTLRTAGGRASIGRPVGNTHVYVLDPRGRLVPPGVPGELFIGGAGVAKGYLKRPELTAERFLPDPFRPDERVYRTGDLVRWTGDGTLEYVGRLDHQIKLRGFRIELGEVESALTSHAAVREAVVICREDRPGDRRLVGYYVPATGQGAQEAEIRQALRASLPAFMVPSALVALPALPLTPNGKLDRRALPVPPESAAGAPQADSEHSTMQTALLSIWQGLFPGRRIGLEDDFFDLGGHSLLAARMVEAVRTGTGFPIPITALYEGATIAQLEQYILEHADAKETPEIVELKPGDGGPSFFLLHGDMTGGGFYARAIARVLPPEQGFYIIPPMSHENFVKSPTIEDMAAHHVQAVRRVQPHGPYLIGGYCVGGLVALEIARRLRADGESVDLVLEIDTSVYNTRFRPWWPLVSTLAFLARPTPPARAVLRAYLMSRVRRVNQMPVLERLEYIAGFPFRYAARKLRKLAHRTVRGRAGTGGAFDFPGMAPLHQVLLHHQRAMIGYMPRHYDGPVELIRATRGGVPGRNPTRDWSRIARNLVVVSSDQTHHSILFTELPELVRAAVARARRPPGT